MLECGYIFCEDFLNVIREVDVLDLDTTNHEVNSIVLRNFASFGAYSNGWLAAI